MELEPEQIATIDLPFHGNHVITGPPGGGKTVTAVYRAWALATARRQVVLLTRSNLLHQYLGQMAPNLTESVRVVTWHRWIREFWRARFRCDPPFLDEEGWQYDWIEALRVCIVDRVRSDVHLVIDEGQNLPVDFFRLVRTLGMSVTVFADENQRIDDDQSTVSEICRALALRAEPILLRENLRNSREIAVLASIFRKDVLGELPLPERSGRIPTVGRVPSLEHLVAEMARYFSAHRERSIGIICRSTRMLLEIQGELGRLGLAEQTQAYVHDDRFRRTVDFSVRPIRIVTTASMKGLEFDSVFVPDVDAYTEDPTGVDVCLRLFVMCTRAREELHFAHRGPEEPPVLSRVPDSLLARRTA
ncbi:AAA family ATPase [Streptomyces xiamenensis]|uniref:AAA family ATPase n=1 Tax=Streptomyces xiamenensis TaxID=408015 RepID=UPI00367FA976